MKTLISLSVSLVALAWGVAVQAQEVAQAAPTVKSDTEEPVLDSHTIIVTGERIKGQLIVDQPPLAEYDAADIASFGGSSIADILDALGPSTISGRGSRGGPPVILVNGIRISNFREISNYPPESIAKVEVFAEDVAQRFGFDPDQRVVNIVLKNDYSALTASGEFEGPARGGYTRNEEEGNFLKIQDGGRLNFNLKAQDASALTEAERGFVVPSSIPGIADLAPYRTLLPDTYSVEGTATFAKACMDSGSSVSLNADLSRNGRTSMFGAREVGGTVSPLEKRSVTNALSFGGGYNKKLGDWQAAFTSDNTLSNSDTQIDRRTDASYDTAITRIVTTVNKATFTGYPIVLPAGEMGTTFDFGLDWKRLEGSDTRTGVDSQVTRRRLRAGVNLAVPLTKRDTFLGAIGNLSANLGGGVENLSDFGTQKSWTAGLSWVPLENLNLQATRIWRQVAPSISSLGNPSIATPGVPLVDFATGNEVFATVVTGGNPNLVAETDADWQLSANWQLPFWKDTRLQVDYAINRSRDVTLDSPSYTADFEDAFPDRVTRDTVGNLTAVDLRPVTLYRTASRTLSFGLSTRGAFGKARLTQAADTGGPEPRNRGFGGPPSGGAAPDGQGGQRPGFDPQRFEQLRKQFCSGPEDAIPDISQVPERMRDRLMTDGKVDPAKVRDLKQRFCSAQTGQQFAAMRAALCADPFDPAKLPPEMLARLKGPEGEIDQARLAQMKTRICATGGPGTPPTGGDGQRSNAPRGGGGPGGGMPFGRGPGGDGRGRYFINANYSIALQNDVQIAPDGPVYDQLAGQVIGGGVVPQHTASLQGGFFWNGFGTRVSANYIGKARLQGGGSAGSSDLFYGDIATIDLRLFADLGQVLKQDGGVLKGFRVAFVVDNIFDTRRKVTDAQGNVPDAYNPLRLDPVGRYLGIDLRKMF